MWSVREATAADTDAVAGIHQRSWGATTVIAHGVIYDLRSLPTLVCVDREERVAGALTMRIEGDGVEVVSIDAAQPRAGAGSALLEAAKSRAPRRLWLVTTNDNLDALRFYQRRGLRLVGVDPGAVDRARRLKPAIPLVGAYGIEIHDELTLEWLVPPATTVRI